MSTPLTPPYGARGIYTLGGPWATQAPPQVVYTCIAIRSFEDIYNENLDVFGTYYQPMGLTQTAFTADTAANANIITLQADSKDPTQLFGGSSTIYVPDTYITSYPNQAVYTYQRIVLSADLGSLPDTLDCTELSNQVSTLCSNLIGVNAAVLINKAPTTNSVTATENAALEAARLGAITLNTSEHARLISAQNQIALLTAKLTAIMQAMAKSAVFPPPLMSSMSILNTAIANYISPGLNTSHYTLGPIVAGTAPYDSKVTITGDGVALSGSLTISYLSTDAINTLSAMLAALNVNLMPANFTLSAVSVAVSSSYNSEISITGATGSPVSGTMTVYYNRVDLTQYLGSASVNLGSSQLTAASGNVLTAINNLYGLNLTSNDYVVTGTGPYTLTPAATSIGWNGAALTVNIVTSAVGAPIVTNSQLTTPNPTSSLTILNQSLQNALNPSVTPGAFTISTTSAGTAPFDTKVTLTGVANSPIAAVSSIVYSYKASDITNINNAILNTFNTNLMPSIYTIGTPTSGSYSVGTSVVNTEIVLTGAGGLTPLSGTLTLYYDRLDLTVLLGSASITITSAQFTSAGNNVLTALNTLYDLSLTTADYTVSGTGPYTLTPVSTSIGWVGLNLTVTVV